MRSLQGSGLPAPRAGSGVGGAERPEPIVFCTLATSGGDPTQDDLVSIRAWRPGAGDDEPAVFERDVARRSDGGSSSTAVDGTARPVDSGATQHRAGDTTQPAPHTSAGATQPVASASTASAAWCDFVLFAAGDRLVVPDALEFAAWSRRLGTGSEPEGACVIGLVQAAALLFPGRLALRRAELVPLLLGEASRDLGPLELHAALRELARRFFAQEEDVVRVAVSGYTRAARGLCTTSPRAAACITTLLALLDRPSRWPGVADTGPILPDDRIATCRAPELPIADLLETLRPRSAREAERWATLESVPPDREEPLPFAAEDRALLDEIFTRHLPARFASERGSGASPVERPGQHDVARRIADTLGSRELLLVHAPTGTGKTLAYLVPALLWARRHDVRVGIATYTRALQEQALDREVPRALAVLARAGIAGGTRVSLLKGRENYLCWRALRIALPEDEDEGEVWLAWTALALFALSDLDGDLDRLPQSPPVALESSAAYVQAITTLVRQVRARTACCAHKDDRETCAAEVARRRAEKSHVVLINHAFALARQEFFRHLVFDECEHLHDQAHNAWSDSVGFRTIRAVLGRLAQPERPERSSSRAILDRLTRMLLEGTPSYASLARAKTAWQTTSHATLALERAVESFLAWREIETRGRGEGEVHALLQDLFTRGEGEVLLGARCALVASANELESACAEVAERLEPMPVRGAAGLRRALEIARAELQEILAAVEAWLPLDEGRPAFRASTFYDVERDARGEPVLAARVLLPNEYLGRGYYPQLSSAVFLSATTWLQESFEGAQAYLGLDRAASPAAGEDRPASIVRTFRSPEVFDYARVLVAVPRDAPPAGGPKDEFLDYVRRFVAHLGERTRGRMLVLFTNAQDAKQVGQDLVGFFRARSIGLWFQNMQGSVKEELSELFRARVDSVLLGVDTFWYGADYPGETLEHLVIVKLPYGVPDRYHHAQCAALGVGEQRRRIYLPKALAKFRQGFGRLMRRESDRGCVYLLDGRVLEPRHRMFLRELPIEDPLERFGRASGALGRARFVRGDTDRCIAAALEHMGLTEDVRRRGLDASFAPGARSQTRVARAGSSERVLPIAVVPRPRPVEPVLDIAPEDVPF